MAGSAGVTKVLDKIEKNVEAGNYYEAQQMLKTVYHRHRAKKQSKESYVVLKEGAVMQLRNKQVTCGVELGLLMLEAYNTDKVLVDEEPLQAVVDILRAFPAISSSSSAAAEQQAGPDPASVAALDELVRFVSAAVKWALKRGNTDAARLVQDLFAQYIWVSYGWRCMGRASLHFVRGQDAALFASALHMCSAQAPSSEADLLITRAVLQALATASSKQSTARQLAYARDLLFSYLELCGREAKAGVVALDTPLVHFAQLLLEALEKRSLPLERLLKGKYEATLMRDPVLGAYLGIVERVYLGVGGGDGGGLSGMLGGMLKELLAGDDGGSDEEEDDD